MGFDCFGWCAEQALNIVNHFGAEHTLDILAHKPGRLVEVKGVSKKTAKAIKAAWSGHAAEQERRVALTGLGVPFSHVGRIIDRWGGAAASIVTNDPYRLASEAGMSFTMADTVAALQGPERQALHSVERYAAATVHALRESIGRGHCCLPATALRAMTTEVLCKPVRLLLLLFMPSSHAEIRFQSDQK
jgi:exodeoxyribonuclease V alpha subunit